MTRTPPQKLNTKVLSGGQDKESRQKKKLKRRLVRTEESEEV